jgi:tetratricopeptide (TPR) repeat protein
MPYEKSLEGLRYQIKQLEDAGRYPQAEGLHKQILERLGKDKTSADYREALIDYGGNLFGQGRYVSSVTSCRKASKILLNNINTMVAQDVRILHLTAESHQRLEQTLNARVCLEQLLALFDGGLAQEGSKNLVLENLTKLALRTNDLDSAQNYLQRLLAHKAFKAEPVNRYSLAPLIDELVKRLTTDGEYARARHWSLKEVQLHGKHWYQPNDYQKSHAYGKALHRLATICRQLGQVRAARVLYKAQIKVVGPHLGSQYAELSDSIANFFLLDTKDDTR